MDTNPLKLYAQAFLLSRAELSNELHVLPARISTWQCADSLPVTAGRLLALRLAQRRGKYPNTLPQETYIRRVGVYQMCQEFNMHWKALADVLGRTHQNFKSKYVLSKHAHLLEVPPVYGNTLASHEVWYIEILHHLTTVEHVVPPKESPWPGGSWDSLWDGEGQIRKWWVRHDQDSNAVMRSRAPDVIRPPTDLERKRSVRAHNRFFRAT